MKFLPVLLATFLLAGCSSNSGVVPMGSGRFLVSRQAATGFSGSGTLKADAIREANSYCQRDGRTAEVLKTWESSPPFIFANFPKAEVQFKCVESEAAGHND